jgi:hypothetical protein
VSVAAGRASSVPETPGESPSLGDELRRLSQEISTLLGVPCVIGNPADDHPDHFVRIDTVRVLAPPYRADNSVARVNAEVLVQAHGPDHLSAADTVARCMLELMARGGWDLVSGQPDAAWWMAYGQPPTAAFMISIPVTLPIVRRPAPPVRHPLEVKGANLRQVNGRLLAEDGTPLSGGRIRLHPYGTSTITGHDGRWSLNLPNVEVQLDITAKGTRATYALVPDAERDTTLPGSPTRLVDITLPGVGAAPPPQGTPATT